MVVCASDAMSEENKEDGGSHSEDQDDEEEEESAEELLAEAVEMFDRGLEGLGSFPDKAKINALTMIVEDHVSCDDDPAAGSDPRAAASSLYAPLLRRLLSPATAADRKLPLLYLLDSILKNVGGVAAEAVRNGSPPGPETCAQAMFGAVWAALDPDTHAGGTKDRSRLRHVLASWEDARIFPSETLRAMRLAVDGGGGAVPAPVVAKAPPPAPATAPAIATRLPGKATTAARANGSVGDAIPPALWSRMEMILDEMFEGMEGAGSTRTSLKDLGRIDPDLFDNIRSTAADALEQQRQRQRRRPATPPAQTQHPGSGAPDADTDGATTPPPPRPNPWEDAVQKNEAKAHDVIRRLHHGVRRRAAAAPPSVGTAALCGAALAAAAHLNLLLGRGDDASPVAAAVAAGPVPGHLLRRASSLGEGGRGGMLAEPSRFTNDGLKERNSRAVGSLYDDGMPHVCERDGRRFKTQRELSSYLDEVFRRSQASKLMERADDRGWFQTEEQWTGQAAQAGAHGTAQDQAATEGGPSHASAPDGGDACAGDGRPETVPADESRSRCRICGRNFDMFFDDEEGEWLYRNCREVEVAGAGADAHVLVHGTCCDGLGAARVVRAEQLLPG